MAVISKVYGLDLGGDHGNLSGRSDDDHTQYILADGTRSFTGNIQANASGTLDIGSSGLPFKSLYLNSTLSVGTDSLQAPVYFYSNSNSSKPVLMIESPNSWENGVLIQAGGSNPVDDYVLRVSNYVGTKLWETFHNGGTSFGTATHLGGIVSVAHSSNSGYVAQFYNSHSWGMGIHVKGGGVNGTGQILSLSAYNGSNPVFEFHYNGSMIVNGTGDPLTNLDVRGNEILQASAYLNWGSTVGSTGYGLRDNSGTIEVKNSSGSWDTVSVLADHGALTGLTDDDHTQYLLANASRALTADWDIGSGRMISADKIQARSFAGLSLFEDSGTGIFVKDGGNVGIQNVNPNYAFDVTGDLHIDSVLRVDGGAVINGNLTVSGTQFATQHETVQITDNLLLINNGEVGPGVTVSGAIAGIEVDRGTLANYRFVFEENNDYFMVGVSGSEQAVATREDTPTTSGVPYWDNNNYQFITDSLFTYSSGTLYVDNISSNSPLNLQVAGSTVLTLTTAGNVELSGGITETNGVLKQNLLTNSGFGVWSNSTLENVGSDLAPDNCCTAGTTLTEVDSTTGWTNVNMGTFASDTEGTEPDGSHSLHLIATGASQYAKLTTAFVTEAGKLYSLKTKYKVSVGDFGIFVGSVDETSDLGVHNALADASWTTDTLVFEATSTTSYVYFQDQSTNVNVYIDTVTLYEVTPGCVAADLLAPDGPWRKGTSGVDLWREHNGSNTKDGSFYSLKAYNSVGSEQTALFYNIEVCELLGISGKTITTGVWIKTDGASQARLGVYDSVNGYNYTSYNTGTGWEWFEYTDSLSSAATGICYPVVIRVAASGTAYISQPMTVFGNSIGEGNYTPIPQEYIAFESSPVFNSFSGATFSDVAKTTMNLEVESNGKIPKGINALDVFLYARDSDTSVGSPAFYLYGRDNTYPQVACNINNSLSGKDSINSFQAGRVTCDANGDIAYLAQASGANTLTITIRVHAVKLR